jgi:hypothetical protein
MVLLGDVAQVNARECTVCIECNIDSEIILEHPMELLGDVGLVESLFIPFGDSVSIGAR